LNFLLGGVTSVSGDEMDTEKVRMKSTMRMKMTMRKKGKIIRQGVMVVA
jgi:hypothetical protein